MEPLTGRSEAIGKKTKPPLGLTWREYEELVARVERMMTASGVRVTRDDEVIDQYGAKRQLDVSVRIDTGTTELLIFFECRNRQEASDITWVEAVAEKRNSIGAAKAILVSNKGLSRSAISAARAHAVEIRTLSQVNESLLPHPFPMHFKTGSEHWRFHKLEFAFIDELLRADHERIDLLAQATEGEGLILEVDGVQSKSIRQHIEEILAGDKPHLPPESPGGLAIADLLLGRRGWLIENMRRHELKVCKIHFSILCVEEKETSAFVARYESDSERVNHYLAENRIVREGVSMPFTAVTPVSGGAFRVNIPYEFLDERARIGVDPVAGITLEIDVTESGDRMIRRMR